MLIVASHAIVSSFLYHQNPSRFITSNVGPSPGTSDRENAEEKHVSQDLTLQLLQCCDVESLGSAIRNGLRSYIPEAYGGALFYVDESNGDVITADNAGLTVCSPTPLCIQQAYGEKQQVILTMESTPACVLDNITNTNGKSYTNQTQVLCYPVLAGQNGTVSAVLAVAIDEITIKVAEKLSWLEKQIAACYSHIQRTFQGRAAEERASQQLIKLCGELYDQDAAKLQLKVLKYLEDQTQAECAFLLLVVPETQELFCQVIGKHILEEEIRFPGQSSSFSVALETKQPLNLDDIPVENRKGIEEVIEIPLRSFLCVPVTSRNDDNLIALACLVNKQNGSRFTDRDVTCIRQCFRYTATVLTSTLAFQNERKIKIQTQALLQVARHLFTNLGELVKHNNTSFDNFPYIRSREWEVNVWGSTLYEAILTNRLDKKICRNTRKIGNLFSRHCTKCEKVCYGCSTYPNCTRESDGVCNLDRDVGLGTECRNCQERFENKQRQEQYRRSTSESTEIYIQENAEDDSRVLQGIMESSFSQNKSTSSHLNKLEMIEITSLDKKKGAQATKLGEMIGKLPDNFDEIKQEKAVIVIDTTDLAEIAAREKENSASLTSKYDKSLLSPKTYCEVDEESDYASAYTHDSGNWRNSQLEPNELESIFSYQTATDFDNDDDNGDVSLKVSYDNDSDRDIKHLLEKQNALSYLHASESKESDTFVKRGSLDNLEIHENDDEYDTWTHPAKIRLSNSEPFIFRDPSDIFDSRPDLNNAFVSSTSDLEDESQSVRPDTAEEIVESFKPDTLRVSGDVTEKGLFNEKVDEPTVPHVLITLEKVDISDIQAKSTELKSFTENDLTKLLREVMAQARNLTQAERCSVFLIDDETDELVAKVFDGISTTKDNEVQEEIRLPSTQGIAGHVATSGELLNIKDAYSHPLFYRGIDDSTGFRTRNILCFPIKNEEGKIMGVAQLCNKKTGPFFTQFDEDLATAFGVYCCISISHSLLYKKVIDSQVRNSLANELMMYHMKSIMYKKLKESQHRKSLANELMIYHMQVSPEDVAGLISVEIPHPRFLHPDFVEFCYAPRTLPESKTLLACLSMFEDLNLISRWRIKRETLARFILMVKKGYRNPPYHNWIHAYTVAQFCYQLIKNMKMEKYLDEIEIYALFVSCLCHDIDHRGTNNSFQTASKSVLAALYSSEGSVLERHHFAQTMCILNTEGCNIFEHLNSREYQQMLDLVRDIILATDLAHHLKILKTIREMAVRGYDRNQLKDHKLLLCLLMTSCDLSDQTKPWDNTKNVAALIYKEFFTQGDMEKASGFQPAEMMDRERAQIPEVQIGFLDHIALPVYNVLSDIFPEGQEINDAVENNKKHWEKIRNLIKLKRGGSCARMTFDEVIAIENESDDTDMVESSEQLNHSVSNGSG